MNSENTNLMQTVRKTLKNETCLDRNVRVESWSKLISMFLERWEKVEATNFSNKRIVLKMSYEKGFYIDSFKNFKLSVLFIRNFQLTKSSFLQKL